MNFPYLDGEPVVPLEIQNQTDEWHQFHGYLDSGAGYSVFHADVAEILNIRLYRGRKILVTVGDGSKIETFIHKLPVKFAGKKFIAEISFSSSLGIGTNIVGLKSFFDNFKICFNNQKRLVEVKPFKIR